MRGWADNAWLALCPGLLSDAGEWVQQLNSELLVALQGRWGCLGWSPKAVHRSGQVEIQVWGGCGGCTLCLQGAVGPKGTLPLWLCDLGWGPASL